MISDSVARQLLAAEVGTPEATRYDAERHPGGWEFYLGEDAPEPAVGDITTWVVSDDGAVRPVLIGEFASTLLAGPAADA